MRIFLNDVRIKYSFSYVVDLLNIICLFSRLKIYFFNINDIWSKATNKIEENRDNCVLFENDLLLYIFDFNNVVERSSCY